MPDLSSPLAVVVFAARLSIAAYATLATILMTACLTLHALAAVDRRAVQNLASRSAFGHATARRLFVPVATELATERDEA